MSDLITPPEAGRDRPLGLPPPPAAPPRVPSNRVGWWLVVGGLALVLVALLGAGLWYTSQLRGQIDELERGVASNEADRESFEAETAALSDDRAAFDREVSAFREDLGAFEEEVLALPALESRLAACEGAASSGQEFTTQFESWLQMDAAWWATAEGSEEETVLGLELEAALSSLRDAAAGFKFAAAACLDPEA
jgi:hypothetical protein